MRAQFIFTDSANLTKMDEENDLLLSELKQPAKSVAKWRILCIVMYQVGLALIGVLNRLEVLIVRMQHTL